MMIILRQSIIIRIAGGYTVDLYNHTYECDLFEMYADVVVGNSPKK